MPGREPSRIKGYHAHVYYDENTRGKAERLRARLADRFAVRLGRWHDELVGPHPRPSYQVAFRPEQFAEIVPWLMLNRSGLTIFLHPETGDDVPDHRDFPIWLGESIEINLEGLQADG